MPFIKVQKLVRDESGAIRSGSAAVVDTSYVRGAKYHSAQAVRERLGKVVWLADDRRSGVFASPTRGLVEYDADTDGFAPVAKGDERLANTGAFPEPPRHLELGPEHLLLSFLGADGVAGCLREALPDDRSYQRALAHVTHGVVRDGSRETCDNMVARSFAALALPGVPPASLRSDTAFFSAMGADGAKVAFFRAFARLMRRTKPGFGRACYVDSTPLPNDAVDNPLNALCSHGLRGAAVQMRLALVLDETTGLPVWYEVVPGNVLDLSTIKTVMGDVLATLGIEVVTAVLDAGYASRELLEAFSEGERDVLVRMPARRGYPYRELWRGVRSLIGKGKYAITRSGHLYFARRRDVEVQGVRLHCYVYVDQTNATPRFARWLDKNQERFDGMSLAEKDWETVRQGYFVLMSTKVATPREILDEYFCRTEIEGVFKTSKDYLGLLPLRKWSDLTVRGKILADIIGTIVVLRMRKALAGADVSLTEVWGKARSLSCYTNADGRVVVETPSRQVREYYKALGVKVPSSIDVREFDRDVLGLEL